MKTTKPNQIETIQSSDLISQANIRTRFRCFSIFFHTRAIEQPIKQQNFQAHTISYIINFNIAYEKEEISVEKRTNSIICGGGFFRICRPSSLMRMAAVTRKRNVRKRKSRKIMFYVAHSYDLGLSES